MKIEFLENLTEQEVDELSTAGVYLDDSDYILVCPSDAIEETDNYTEDNLYAKYMPKSLNLDRLLTGCCDNVWYLVEFRGSKVAIGVAYHLRRSGVY